MNPLLERAKKGLLASAAKLFEAREEKEGDEGLAEELDASLERVVLAGNTIMFDPKTHANMELVRNPEAKKDPAGTISRGIAGLAWLMYVQSKKTIDPQVLVMAGLLLMCDALDFAERGLGVKVDENVLANTTQHYNEVLFAKLGITQAQLKQYISQGKISDPSEGLLSKGGA